MRLVKGFKKKVTKDVENEAPNLWENINKAKIAV